MILLHTVSSVEFSAALLNALRIAQMPGPRSVPSATTHANATQGKAEKGKPPTRAEQKLIDLIGRGRANSVLLQNPPERPLVCSSLPLPAPSPYMVPCTLLSPACMLLVTTELADLWAALQGAANGKPKRPEDPRNPPRAKQGHCRRWDGTSGSCREGWLCPWQFDHVPGVQSPGFKPNDMTDGSSSNGSSGPAKQPAADGKPKDPKHPPRAKEGHCRRWDGTSGSCRQGWLCPWQFDHVPGVQSRGFKPHDMSDSSSSIGGSSRSSKSRACPVLGDWLIV